MKNAFSQKTTLLMTTALVAMAGMTPSQAFADCAADPLDGTGQTWVCSGPTVTAQMITSGFGVSHVYTTSGFSLTDPGGLYFQSYAIDATLTDVHASVFTGGVSTFMWGNLTIDMNSDITVAGAAGIHTYHTVPGTTVLNFDGRITATTVGSGEGIGISSRGEGDRIITVGANAEIIAESHGISVQNGGSSSTVSNFDVTVAGDIKSTAKDGVYLNHFRYPGYNYYGLGDVALFITDTGNVVSDTGNGVFIKHDGVGDVGVKIDGQVTAAYSALEIVGGPDAVDISIDVGSTAILSSQYGIRSDHSGVGAHHINVDGKIIASSMTNLTNGIYANNGAGTTDLLITTGDQSLLVSSNGWGIYALQSGSGTTTISLGGDVEAVRDAFTFYNNGTGAINIDVKSGATLLSHADRGIAVEHNGTGKLHMSVNGTVTSYDAAIRLDIGSGADASEVLIGSTAKLSSELIAARIESRSNNLTKIEVAAGAEISGDEAGFIFEGRNIQLDTAGNISGSPTGTYGEIAIAFLPGMTGKGAVNIHGGKISGDVIDFAPSNGFSTVTIAGDFTSEGDFDVSHFNVAKGKTFTAGANTTVKTATTASNILGTFRVLNDAAVLGGINNSGTLALESGKLTVDTMTAGATGNIVIGVTSASSHGQLLITGGAAQMAKQTVSVDLAPVNTLSDGDEILIIDGTGTVVGGPAAGGGGAVVSSGSPIWKFMLHSGADVTGGDDSQLYLFASKAAPAAQIEVDGAIVAATLTFADTAMNLTSERLSTLRVGTPENTGVSAGNDTGSRVWMQAIGQKIDQSMRKGIAGYDANLYGATIGVDTDWYLKEGVLGLAFSYARSKIDSKDTFSSRTNIDSYQMTLYGDYNWDNGMYVEGMTAYAFNTNNKTRHNAGGAGLNAKSDFDSHSFALRGETGRTFTSGAAFVTPFALASWMRYAADNYSETGAGAGNLSVDSKTLNQIDLGIGAKAGMTFKVGDNNRLVPELHAVYRRDMLGDSLSTTQSYVAGGGPTVVAESPDPARNKFTLGARVKYYSEGGFELTGAYDFDVKEDFTSHTGLLRAGWQF